MGTEGLWLTLVAGLALALGAPTRAMASEASEGAARAVGKPLPKERVFANGSSKVSASEALDEMIDELVADVVRLGPARLSPLLVDRILLTPNLHPALAATLEARLIAALHRAGGVSVLHCLECVARRGRVEAGAWVVRRGNASRQELRELATVYGAQAVLRASFGWNEQPEGLSLDVTVVRAEDAAVVLAEGYRIEPRAAMLYRGADTAQSRAERLQDLEDRLERRPRLGHAVFLAPMWVPSDDKEEGSVLGASAIYQLHETFGAERQWRVGLNVGGFLHSTRLAGALLSAQVSLRLTEESLYGPAFRAGLLAGGLVTGGGGNTPMGGLQLEILFAHRLALHGGALWIHPLDLAEKGIQYGGLTPFAGAGIVW